MRRLRFRRDLTLCCLTERRSTQPYGMEGGESGAKGRNILERRNGQVINLGAKCAVEVHPGVSLARSILKEIMVNVPSQKNLKLT